MPVLDAHDLAIRKKYLKHPSIEQIVGFIEEIGVSCSQFERYYSIPTGIILQAKGGFKPLPVKYWPIFYERIVPQYGTSFKVINDILLNKTYSLTKNITKTTQETSFSHDRLTTIK